MLFYSFILLGSIIFLDACLSGDNAVVIAMAANALKASMRDAAIYGGMALAAVARIALALMATTLLQLPWVGFLGGVGLLWVSYRLFLALKNPESEAVKAAARPLSLAAALITIVVADISMSLDNVLAVAALARGHVFIMALGILASVAMLAFAAKWVADVMRKRPWLNWIGLALIVYVAVDLIAGTYDARLSLLRGI